MFVAEMNEHYFPILRGLWEDYVADVDVLLQHALDVQERVRAR